MRLHRMALRGRLTDVNVPTLVVLEAPTGFGKSWLLRKSAPAGAIRVRGEIGPLADDDLAPDSALVIDDAHLLAPDQVERLVEYIEEAPATARLILSGRVLDDSIHEVAHLVDGLVLDASALAIAVDEVAEVCPEFERVDIEQLVETADGCVRVIAAAIAQARVEPHIEPATIASRLVRTMSAASLQHLDSHDAGMVSLLIKAPDVDRSLLARLGGPGFVDRVLAAGVMLRRRAAGGFDLVASASVPTTAVEAELSARLGRALLERGRPVEATGLLLDAGEHDEAAATLMGLPESVTRYVAPRTVLALLARLGTVTEREPALLLMRAAASAQIGRVDLTGVDIDRAMQLAESADPAMRRRVSVEAAEWLLLQGRHADAVATVNAAINELGPGEDRTYARAHAVLADAASSSCDRAALQRAAEWYRVAAAAWDGCGEHAKARLCRCDLAAAVLEPLGRFDEALTQIGSILASGDLSDAERTWMLLCEGLILVSANRLDSAEARFERVAELGYVQDNPRIIASSAWGRALVAARREDVSGAVRWFGTAENTALGTDDDELGVTFHCDAATALGALGELELAEKHLALATQRGNSHPDKLALTKFVLEARRGVRGDVAAQLTRTPPVESWRVLLVSALAAARHGAVAEAQHLLIRSERELITLGFSDFRTLGERRAHEELRALLRHAPEAGADQPQHAAGAAVTARRAADAKSFVRRVRVIGGTMVVEERTGVVEIPAGNPQRLVGVVVANGGLATFDRISEAIWPGDDVDASRVRVRNVLLRLRRAMGEILVRAGSGLRLAPDVSCDLYEFEQLANDAVSSIRTDPDLAAHVAEQALHLADGPVFGDFEYEEWAVEVRRSVEQRLIALLDLLSVRAEDAGDLALAQSLAERALRLDRYSDSRYVRIAELLTLQGRTAAAMAVLEDATEVARDLGGAVPPAVKRRRDDLMRRASNG